MFLLCPKHEGVKSSGNYSNGGIMKKRMLLQLFEDGSGAGSGNQGGNSGHGNGANNAGGNQGTFSYAQAEKIATARAERAERSALKSYFQQQGMTEDYEVAWHAGARPTHAVWQGRVWSKRELYDVCGLGTVTGLLGVNCYHEYYPFFPGLSERNWTDEWLDAKNLEESEPKKFGGKEYTLYEAKQRQRQMEVAMRAQREKVRLLQKGKADPDEILLYKAKYQGQLNEYSRFCRKMKLTEERERIYLDMHGRVAPAQTAYMERGITKKRVPKQREHLIDKLAINSNEYKRKYSGITGNVKVDDNIYKYAKAGLTHRDGTNREDLYILSKTTGDILGKNISSTEEFGVRANRSIKDAIKDNLWNTIGLHIHPNNTPPTGSDFETAFKRCYNLGVVACADGSVYSYGCSDRYVSARIIDDTIEKYRKMVDSSGKKVYSNYIDAHLAALEQIRKDYGIWYEARR